MKLFRPVGSVVEAAQWTGDNLAEVRELLGDDRPLPRPGWFVVRRSGGITLISPETFLANYEPVLTLN